MYQYYQINDVFEKVVTFLKTNLWILMNTLNGSFNNTKWILKKTNQMIGKSFLGTLNLSSSFKLWNVRFEIPLLRHWTFPLILIYCIVHHSIY